MLLSVKTGIVESNEIHPEAKEAEFHFKKHDKTRQDMVRNRLTTMWLALTFHVLL